ncbi:helix-turn-helix domain-containing protein [Saccharopolyspora sp. 5N102]|uniref:helix-turn-helix domain-containing protein n=1 Tax=Saccharopolyspora sp. 5N102 TaxID=3375155 RepID=UPI00378CCDAD
MARTSPTFRRRRLARRIRQLREEARMTQEKAAAGLDMSTSALSRKETGEVATSVHEVRSMMDLYDRYDPDLLDLARAAREKPWWHLYGITKRGYYDLEEEASSVREWQFSFVPGMFQTADYARELFEASGALEADDVENAIAARMRRRSRLFDEDFPLSFSAVVDESVLQRPVGGAAVMHGQLLQMLEFAEIPNVNLQVMPLSAGAHRGMEGSFTLLSYAAPEDPDILFIEHATGSLHVEKVEAVSAATLNFERLRAEALSSKDSATLIHRLVSGL